MYKYLLLLLFMPVYLFSGIIENKYFQDQENCLNLKYISSKKIADTTYHAFYGQVSENDDYKYYLYVFRNTNSQPAKFQLSKLNFIEEILVDNFDFTVYSENQFSFYYKTTKNNLYFYTDLQVGDKINTELFNPFKNNKDSFLYYSQKEKNVICTPNALPEEGKIDSIASCISFAFKSEYDNKGQFYIKIASKEKYFIYFIKPPYPFSAFSKNGSIFDASDKQLPIFDSIGNGLATRIEDYNFKRIGHEIYNSYSDAIAGLFKQKEGREQTLVQFTNASAVLAFIPDMSQLLESNLNYYYNNTSDLFIPCGFIAGKAQFNITNFIDTTFPVNYRTKFNIKSSSKDYDYFNEFQKVYNSPDRSVKSDKNNYLDLYQTLLNLTYTNTVYYTNIKAIQYNFLSLADKTVLAAFQKYDQVLSNFSASSAALDNLENRYQNKFFENTAENSQDIAAFYDSITSRIPLVAGNYQGYLNSIENSGYLVPDKVKMKTNSLPLDFTEYTGKLIALYHDNLQENLEKEYSSPDEAYFDLLSGGVKNEKFQKQIQAIVTKTYAFMDKQSLLNAHLTNLLLNKTLSDFLSTNKDIQEFCQSNQFYSIEKEDFTKGLIQKSINSKKNGNAPFPVKMKIWNPIQFYQNYFQSSATAYTPQLTPELLKSVSNSISLFPLFTEDVKQVSRFYNEISENLNLKERNNRANENKIVLAFKNDLIHYFDIPNFFRDYVSELKMNYTDTMKNYAKISAERYYFQTRLQSLPGTNYQDFKTETSRFFYGDDTQKYLSQLAQNSALNKVFTRASSLISKQKDFLQFTTSYKIAYQQMSSNINSLVKQTKEIKSQTPDFKKYDGFFKKSTDDNWPVFASGDKKRTLIEDVETEIIFVLTNTDVVSDSLNLNSLRKAVRANLKKTASDIDLSGMLISETHQNDINIRIGELGYRIKGSNLLYEIKKIRAIENNLWIIFTTTTKIPEAYVDSIDLVSTNTLAIPDSFNKMLSENKLIRGDYYDDVVMIYPGRVLLYKHGSTDNSTKDENNLKRLVVLDYSSGKAVIRNDAAVQLAGLNKLFNEKIETIYSYYDEKKNETELIVSMRNNILFLRYNKNGFIHTNPGDSILKNSYIFTDEWNKYIFKYKLAGY